jgi:hypothetical protein
LYPEQSNNIITSILPRQDERREAEEREEMCAWTNVWGGGAVCEKKRKK